MAKECQTSPRNYDQPCLNYSGGQCEGDLYGLIWDVVARQLQDDGSYKFFDVEVGVTTTKDISAPNNKFIRGKLRCISTPYKVSGQLFFDLYSKTGNVLDKDTIELKVAFNEPMSATLKSISNLTRFGLSDPCGDWIPEEDNEVNCICTNGDQEISCNSATGGICCISKNSLDRLCEVLS